MSPRPAAPGVRGARSTPPDRRGDVTGDEQRRLAAGLGRLLTLERRARGWTRAGLAERAGVSQRTVWGLEGGDRRPSTSMLWRLAAALREGRDVPATAALAARLADLAGESLRPSKRMRQARLDAMEAARGGTPDGVPAAASDDLAQVALAALQRWAP